MNWSLRKAKEDQEENSFPNNISHLQNRNGIMCKGEAQMADGALTAAVAYAQFLRCAVRRNTLFW